MLERVAVIFDMDGVIADTLSSLYSGYLDILQQYGKTGSPEEFERLNGANLDEIVEHLALHHDLASKAGELRSHFERNFKALYDHVELVDGIESVLDQLKNNGCTIGLASSARRISIDRVLERHQLQSYFDVVVSGDDVVHAKPHPDIYERASEQCGCSLNFVIEDSQNGVKAAQRAGLIAIHFDPDDTRSDITYYHVAKLRDIPSIVLSSDALILAQSDEIKLISSDSLLSFTPETSGLVESMWQQAQGENPALFNDNVAIYHDHKIDSVGALHVSTQTCEYKYVHANFMSSASDLPKALGVSAIVVDTERQILLGKRSENVTEYSGYSECVPSGGVTVDHIHTDGFNKQIVIELEEETGILAQHIAKIQPLGLIFDRSHKVYDIAMMIQLNTPLCLDQIKSDEYTEFEIIGWKSWSSSDHSTPIVPTSLSLFRLLGYTDRY